MQLLESVFEDRKPALSFYSFLLKWGCMKELQQLFQATK